MAESQTEMAERWDVTDLLDLDHFLQQDADLDEADLVSRDEKIAREDLLPVLGEVAMVGDASQQVRSRGLLIWLWKRRKELARKQNKMPTPGEVFGHIFPVVLFLGAVLAMALGYALVSSLLHTEERYFNVIMFLVATLLPQLGLLVILLGGWVFRGAMGRSLAGGGIGVVQVLVWRLVIWLAGKIPAYKRVNQIGDQWRNLKQRSYLVTPILGMTQTMALMFNVGILGGFAVCMGSMDVRFFWESTPGAAAEETLEKIVSIVSAPWGMMMQDWLPTPEGIAATRITMEGAQKVYPSAETYSATVWVTFLAGSVVFWGLLPRLLLLFGLWIWGKRSIKRYPFVERRYRELWRRLTALRVETSSEGPGDEAVILLWGGLSPDPEKLRKVLLQQLRLNPVKTFAAGNETDVSVDAKIIRQVGDALSEMNPRVRLVIAVESWALAPREATDFLDELRGWVGQDRAIRLLLLGPPNEGRPFSEPSAAEIKTWEDLAADRKDAALTVYPYRK